MTLNPIKVLIVGAGPTGMTAALEFARYGIPVRLIEKTAEPATTSRAIGVQARTLELFEQRGMVDQMVARGNKGVAGSIYDGGNRIFRLEFSHIDSKYNYMLFISQAETEAVLREALVEEGVTIEREVELIALRQSDWGEAVTAVLKHNDGSLENATYEYLIDAEGAHSIARSATGLEFQGKTLEENYALGDVYIDSDLAETDFHIFSSEHGFMGLFPMGSDRFRIIASNPMHQPSKDSVPSLDELQQIYDQRSSIPARFHDMGWSSWFRINSRMIKKLRAGRIFLGGDSAHIHSPAGAQGMNTGIQDMIDLAWKMALVIKRQAAPTLLDTYSDDRIAVIRNLLTKTEGLTKAIGSENPIFRSVFNHIAPWIVSTEYVQQNSTERLSQLGLNYRDSPLSVSHRRPGEIHAGDRLPDMELAKQSKPGEEAYEMQTNLFGLLRPTRFTLLYANIHFPEKTHKQAQALLSPWKHLMEGYQVSSIKKSEQQFKYVFGTGPAILLIRPDGYVAFTGSDHSLPALAEYLERWFPTQLESMNTGELNMQGGRDFWNGLTKDSAQVLICDLQEQIVARSKTTEPEALGRSAAVLCDLAVLCGLPITLSVVPEQDKAPRLLPALEKRAGSGQRLMRASASPFSDTATRKTLADNRSQTLIIAGFATEVVVLHAALDAIQEGYRVLVAIDACGGLSERTENAAIEQARAAGALVTSVVSIATALTPDFTTEKGKRMFEIVQQLRLA